MCTRVFWNDNGTALIVGRTMDWPESTEPILTIFPRGTRHDGGLLLGERIVADNALVWEAAYGTLVVSVYGLGAAEGVNEAGLAAHMLYLNETDFGPVDPERPAIHAALWVQYLLDNAATVREALELQAALQLVMAEARGALSTVHLALEDATGDSAVIEYVEGRPTVYHDAAHRVMTNSPPFDQQLALLAQRDFAEPASSISLPGNVESVDRFTRASYFLNVLPTPGNEREAMASMLAVIRNCSIPFGAPYKDEGVLNTEYRVVNDLTNRRLFFEMATLPSVIWVDWGALDFSEGSGVRTLDPDDLSLSGNVTDRFAPASVGF